VRLGWWWVSYEAFVGELVVGGVVAVVGVFAGVGFEGVGGWLWVSV
jgi:hypothetical protein